jgi:RND family efflux transporter MFP subunit
MFLASRSPFRFPRSLRLGLLALGAVTSLGAGAAAQDAAPVEASRPGLRLPSVTVAPAARGQISDTAVVTGTLVAREEVLVVAQVDGLAIRDILVEEGDTVAKGAVLARLARETVEASLAQNTAQIARAEAAIAQAEGQIAEAEATRAQAEASFARARQLRAEGVTTAEIFDQRQATAQTAAARVEQAQQALRLARADRALAQAQRQEMQIRLERTEIKAPAGGIISRRTARLGAIASSQGEALFRIIQDGEIELEADVSETVLARMQPGQPASVLPAGREEALPARVRLVSPEVGRSTRLGRVRLAIATQERLPTGSFARGTVTLAAREGVLVPQSAVQFTAEGARLQVVKGGVVETREVRTGIRSGGRVEILEGLKEGEEVVVMAGTFLRNGDRVTAVAAR